MSFPKLNDFIGKSVQKIEYKRVSLIHSLRNSLARNTITQSSHQKPSNPYQSQVPRQKQNKSSNPITTTFKYDEKIQNNLQFSNDDLYKLLQHLFNKKQHDSSDRNFIRILLLKYFPEDMICAGGKDFVTHIKFLKLSKNDVINFGNQSSIYDKLRNEDQKQNFKNQKLFYLLLRGKVTIKTQLHEFQKCSGQYFGQLEILGQEDLVSIKAKTNTILLTLKQSIFMAHLSHYFTQKYSQLEKKITCFGPILNLVPYYHQLQILNLLYEKDYKTGDKIIQKAQPVTEFIFMNNTDISFSQDRILSEFKTIGLSQYVTMQNPQAQQTLYCMENKTVLAIKTDDLSKFLEKSTIYSFISSKYNNLSSLSASKLATSIDDKTLASQNSCKLQTFVNIKKVKFLGNKGRVLTQPNSSLPSSTPQSKKLTQKYPQYTASFVFIKQNSSEVSTNRKNPKFRHLPLQSTKHKQLKEYLLKTKNSFRKKRWLDQLEGKNQNSIIYNPQKIQKMYSTPKNYNRNLPFADS